MNRVIYIVIGLIAATAALLAWNDHSGATFGMANDKFAQLVWLGIIAASIGIGLVSGRYRSSAKLSHAAIWLGILFALAAGYQYRGPLQDFASNISLGLVPASPHTAHAASGALEVTVGRAVTGHFEVNADVDGTSLRFLIDTGASSIVLSSSDAASAGIDASTLNFVIPVSTANGKTLAAPTRLSEINVGGIIRHDIPALVAAEGAMTDNLLGMEFLDTLSGYAVEQDRMVLKE